MALMFQRLARNFIKNGYFPTDSETIARILSALAPATGGEMRIIDPCAGEGTALAECREHLGAERVQTFGIEYDEERAWHAKELLDRCIHGDFQDCIVSKRSFGLLFLNPPYGDLVSDKAQTGGAAEMKGKKRLEKLFYTQSNALLQFGGVMVLIVPFYVVDPELSGWIASHFDRVTVHLAPEQRFKQVVIMGIRRRSGENAGAAATRERLNAVRETLPPELPAQWPHEPYVVPAVKSADVTFASSRMELRQLADEIRRHPCLWEQFNLHLGQGVVGHRRPLRQLSDWHLSLALAAGQVSGVVHSTDGRTFVIKGDTHKEKTTKVEQRLRDDDSVEEIRTLTDRFVPVIRALDFTPDSPSFGKAITIK
ncbi:MAG: DUF6094 domain-containing protein [Candidatus Sedimenticola sp. (ex Thyasira tokunagai)]